MTLANGHVKCSPFKYAVANPRSTPYTAISPQYPFATNYPFDVAMTEDGNLAVADMGTILSPCLLQLANLSTHLALLALLAVGIGSSTVHQLLLSEVTSCMSVTEITTESRSSALADNLSSRSLATVERDSYPTLVVSALTQRGRST